MLQEWRPDLKRSEEQDGEFDLRSSRSCSSRSAQCPAREKGNGRQSSLTEYLPPTTTTVTRPTLAPALREQQGLSKTEEVKEKKQRKRRGKSLCGDPALALSAPQWGELAAAKNQRGGNVYNLVQRVQRPRRVRKGFLLCYVKRRKTAT